MTILRKKLASAIPTEDAKSLTSNCVVLWQSLEPVSGRYSDPSRHVSFGRSYKISLLMIMSVSLM